MADKKEAIVKCEYCYKYLPGAAHIQHLKDGCLVRAYIEKKQVSKYRYMLRPSQWAMSDSFDVKQTYI